MACVVSTTNSTVAASADRSSSDIPSSSRESLHESRIAQRDHEPNRSRARARPRNQEETNRGRGRERRGGRGGRLMERIGGRNRADLISGLPVTLKSPGWKTSASSRQRGLIRVEACHQARRSLRLFLKA